MELTQLLSNLPAVLIPIALVVYYTNQNNIKWMAERKEIIQALAVERKEWLEWQKAAIERQFAQQEARFVVQERIAIAIEGVKNELHALRGKIQELMGRYEIVATPKERRTGSGDDR